MEKKRNLIIIRLVSVFLVMMCGCSPEDRWITCHTCGAEIKESKFQCTDCYLKDKPFDAINYIIENDDIYATDFIDIMDRHKMLINEEESMQYIIDKALKDRYFVCERCWKVFEINSDNYGYCDDCLDEIGCECEFCGVVIPKNMAILCEDENNKFYLCPECVNKDGPIRYHTVTA